MEINELEKRLRNIPAFMLLDLFKDEIKNNIRLSQDSGTRHKLRNMNIGLSSNMGKIKLIKDWDKTDMVFNDLKKLVNLIIISPFIILRN